MPSSNVQNLANLLLNSKTNPQLVQPAPQVRSLPIDLLPDVVPPPVVTKPPVVVPPVVVPPPVVVKPPVVVPPPVVITPPAVVPPPVVVKPPVVVPTPPITVPTSPVTAKLSATYSYLQLSGGVNNLYSQTPTNSAIANPAYQGFLVWLASGYSNVTKSYTNNADGTVSLSLPTASEQLRFLKNGEVDLVFNGGKTVAIAQVGTVAGDISNMTIQNIGGGIENILGTAANGSTINIATVDYLGNVTLPASPNSPVTHFDSNGNSSPNVVAHQASDGFVTFTGGQNNLYNQMVSSNPNSNFSMEWSAPSVSSLSNNSDGTVSLSLGVASEKLQFLKNGAVNIVFGNGMTTQIEQVGQATNLDIYSDNRNGLVIGADGGYQGSSYTLNTVNVDSSGNVYIRPTNSGYGTAVINQFYANPTAPSTLQADGGTDILTILGNAGTTLIGGSGHDTFAFPDVMGQDTVKNFNTSNDTLQFNKSLFVNYVAAMADAKQVGVDTVFTIDSHNSVTLQNVAKNSLTASNFHIA